MKARSLALVAIVVLLAGACQAAAGPKKIALLLPEKTTARYEAADRPFFETKFKAICPNVEIIYNNATEKADTQQSQAEAALTSGAKVLVLDPVDGKAAKAIVDKAKAQKVPVVSYDRLTQGDIDYYISFDNEQVGKLQGQTLLDKLTKDGKPNAKIVMINGSPKDNNATLFKKGAHSVFDASGLKIVKEDAAANWLPDEARALMDQFITALGKDGFDALYAANDGTSGGAQAAMKAAGIDPKTKPSTGQDAELAAIQRILVGEQYMTVYKAIQPEAEAAAVLACDLLTGTQVPADMTGGKTVTNDTKAVPSVLLTPIAVTKDKVKDTVVKDLFYGSDSVAKICTADFAAACKAAGIQ